MAKETAKDKKGREDPVATALITPDAPVNAAPARTRTSSPSPSHGVTDSVVGVAADAAHVVRRVLPHRTPVYLGGAALVVVGVVDLPAVAGGALVYEALRRWHPSTR